MPRSKRPTTYGHEYEQLLLRAFEQTRNGDFTLQLDTPNAAASLRSKCYAYFKALRSQDAASDFARMADALSLRTAGSALVLFRREDAWDARALRDALGLEKGFGDHSSGGVVSPTANPHLEQLASIRAKRNK